MPFYEGGQVRIHYEEAGSGFPLLVILGGGLSSSAASADLHQFVEWVERVGREPRDRRCMSSFAST